jgi:UDP-glucose 4-epimerase
VKVLITGASSFTGYWFARALARKGHEVTCTFTGNAEGYTGLRRRRIDENSSQCRMVWRASFGSEPFIRLIDREGPWDSLCHHGAFVVNYKNDDFDIAGAVASNTLNAGAVLRHFQERGGRQLVLTGSVFEADEGAGEKPLRAFSPYGVSKGLTAEVFRFWAGQLGMPFRKFVIPNPFGPLEEPRFTSYLMGAWKKGETPSVKTPAYVRDNIHVSLLAKAYVWFLERPLAEMAYERFNPSGYVESQGAFARRFALEMSARLGWKCDLNLEIQKDFPEPRTRINTDVLNADVLGWSESESWDALAGYYGASRS